MKVKETKAFIKSALELFYDSELPYLVLHVPGVRLEVGQEGGTLDMLVVDLEKLEQVSHEQWQLFQLFLKEFRKLEQQNAHRQHRCNIHPVEEEKRYWLRLNRYSGENDNGRITNMDVARLFHILSHLMSCL